MKGEKVHDFVGFINDIANNMGFELAHSGYSHLTSQYGTIDITRVFLFDLI